VRRRRFWAKVTPHGDGRAVVELGGLARTDRAGYGEEFDRLRADLLEQSDGAGPTERPSSTEPATWPGRDQKDA
jgi:cytochrome c biogenesis protein